MNLFDRLLATESEFFAYFGFDPARLRYPERHAIIDLRECYWLILEDASGVPMIYRSMLELTP